MTDTAISSVPLARVAYPSYSAGILHLEASAASLDVFVKHIVSIITYYAGYEFGEMHDLQEDSKERTSL
jgi:hypothetical protein